jgi:hypothetical protein
MQHHQIDLVPGESIRVGSLIVTLVAVSGTQAELQVEDAGDGDHDGWNDPSEFLNGELLEPALA